jgi:hypothetical protein
MSVCAQPGQALRLFHAGHYRQAAEHYRQELLAAEGLPASSEFAKDAILAAGILDGKSWCAQNGFAWRAPPYDPAWFASPDSQGAYPQAWRDENRRQAATLMERAYVGEARNAQILVWGYLYDKPEGQPGTIFHVLSPKGELIADEPYWLTLLDGKGSFKAIDREGRHALLDLASQVARHPMVKGDCIFIGSNRNWAHFLLDFCSNLYHYDHHPRRDSLIPVFGPLEGWQQELLEILGIDWRRGAQLQADMAHGHLYPFESLVIGATPPPAAAYRYLRGKLVAGRASKAGRLFLSRRGQGGRRRIANEAEVEAFLAAQGFECLEIEALPVRDQIDRLASADIVVFSMGAEMGNVALCREDAVIICLIPALYQLLPADYIYHAVSRYMLSSGCQTLPVFGLPADPSQPQHREMPCIYDRKDIEAALRMAERLQPAA